MTWWREADKYGVYFNRDELKTRPRAHPPELRDGGFLSPLDPKGGGTWMTVNKHGVIVALLNHWHLEAKGTRSRGKLVWNLSEETDTPAVEHKLQTMTLSDYSPFILMLMDQGNIKRWEWDGKHLTQESPANPSCSSSFDYENVKSQRETKYSELTNETPLELAHFHTEDTHGAYSVRMLRPDAQTWSRNIISICSENIHWTYHEEFPDFEKKAETWKIDLPRS
ncbi:NRDE family protein [Akkermansiaceae bacterium]|nr:NRDE family protein [Akkermansiaceae bacterium]